MIFLEVRREDARRLERELSLLKKDVYRERTELSSLKAELEPPSFAAASQQDQIGARMGRVAISTGTCWKGGRRRKGTCNSRELRPRHLSTFGT